MVKTTRNYDNEYGDEAVLESVLTWIPHLMMKTIAMTTVITNSVIDITIIPKNVSWVSAKLKTGVNMCL